MNKQVDEIDLMEVLSLFLKKWYILLLSAITFAVIAYVYTNITYIPMYSSNLVFVVKLSNTAKSDDSSRGDDTLTTSKNLVPTYIEILGSRSFLQKISDSIDNVYTPEQIKKMLTIEATNDNTAVIEVVVKADNPEDAYTIAMVISRNAGDELDKIIDGGEVNNIDEPYLAVKPYTTNPSIRNALLGAVFGMILAGAVVFVLDSLDTRIKTSQELVDRYKSPLIGEIPNIGDIKSDSEGTNILNEESKFNVIEAYKMARTNIMFSLSDKNECKKIVITSANASEGKSTNSVNLAITFAQTGARVLLIDADLRQPKVHYYLKVTNKLGLSNFLGGMSKFSECLQTSKTYGFDFMTAGQIPPNPSELLVSEKMHLFLESLNKVYDYVIIDAPPLNIVTDASMLSTIVDGTVLVVRQKSTTHNNIKEAIEKLSAVGTKQCGFLVTFAEENGKKYGNYGKYGKYGYGDAAEAEFISRDDSKKRKSNYKWKN